jgi:hypothetical protein
MADGQTFELAIEFHDPDSDYSVVFEQDAKTGYAYLREGGCIVGDVWLCNRGEAPDEPELSDLSKAPFANPKRFVHAEPPPSCEPRQTLAALGCAYWAATLLHRPRSAWPPPTR